MKTCVLTRNRVSAHLLSAMLLAAAAVSARALTPQDAPPPPMALDADPSYEVATIKPTAPDESKHVWVTGTRLSTADTSLADLMMFAYAIHPTQIVGGPDWLRTTKFDALIQPNLPGRPSTPQMRSIVRKLLADRFQLTFHHVQRELPVYSIVPVKGGPRLTPTAADSIAVNTATINFAPDGMTIHNTTMTDLASLMQRYIALDRPIIDSTNLTGKYDLTLR